MLVILNSPNRPPTHLEPAHHTVYPRCAAAGYSGHAVASAAGQPTRPHTAMSGDELGFDPTLKKKKKKKALAGLDEGV